MLTKREQTKFFLGEIRDQEKKAAADARRKNAEKLAAEKSRRDAEEKHQRELAAKVGQKTHHSRRSAKNPAVRVVSPPPPPQQQPCVSLGRNLRNTKKIRT